MVAPRNLGQQVALGMGWTGAGQGAGGHASWVNTLNPQQRAQYDAMLAGRAPTTAAVATMPLLQEPLHEWEKQGLSQQAQGVDTSQMTAILNELRAKLGGASGMVAQGTAAVTPDEVARIQNPYASTLKTRLSDAAEKIRARVTADQGLRGARSFGDTATGVQMGMIDEEELRGRGDIDYNTWEAALNQINAERNRLISGAGTEYGGAIPGASTAYDMAGGIGRIGQDNALSKIASGRYVRGYNQNINDIMEADRLAERNYPLDQLAKTLNLLAPYGSNTSSSQVGGMASPLTQAGGALRYVGDLFSGGNKQWLNPDLTVMT